MNCRDLPPEAWARARNILVFYFSHRYRATEAEDLAQQTLMAIWRREDYQFEKEEDFQQVCYGFASRVFMAEVRKGMKRGTVPIDSLGPEPVSRDGPRTAESSIFLKEVQRVGATLDEREWQLILDAADAQMAGEPYSFPRGVANAMRVALHRARKKLAKSTGWPGR